MGSWWPNAPHREPGDDCCVVNSGRIEEIPAPFHRDRESIDLRLIDVRTIRAPKSRKFVGLQSMNSRNIRTPKGCEMLTHPQSSALLAQYEPRDTHPVLPRRRPHPAQTGPALRTY